MPQQGPQQCIPAGALQSNLFRAHSQENLGCSQADASPAEDKLMIPLTDIHSAPLVAGS